jgi:ketosteroid isomerase-like protein
MLDKLAPPAEETARETTEAWIEAFGAALARGDEHAISGLFAEDGHWRNLFGLSWQFATFRGNDVLARELQRCACEVDADGFRIDAARLPPRRSAMAGREVIEAFFRSARPTAPAMARCGC